MTNRFALLIGVPSHDNALFASMPHVIAADLRRMRSALEQSAYTISECGVAGTIEATRNGIKGAMKQAFRLADRGSVLLIYYSGHGVIIDGISYLVPKDAFEDRGAPDPDSLVPLVPSSLEECRARLVVFVVDACRNDLGDSLDPPQGGSLPFPPDGAFVMVSSCSPGEVSSFGPDGSYYTRALAEALDRRSGVRTIGEVLTEATRRLNRLGALTDGVVQRPRPVWSNNNTFDNRSDNIVICEGDMVGELWRAAAANTPLWSRTSIGVHSLEALRSTALDIVERCAKDWLDARTYLAKQARLDDPWSTQDYPIRVLRILAAMIPVDADLGPAEIAAAIAVPFIREAALGAGLKLAADTRPQDFSRLSGGRARSDLEITHDQHEHVWRRAEGLAHRKRFEARDALAMWLVHRWLAGRSTIWTNDDVKNLVERLGEAASVGADHTSSELCDHISVLMRCVDADNDDELIVNDLRRIVDNPRMRAVGAALWLAGVMAADARRMPSIIVDHIGVTDEFSLAELHQATEKVLEWRRSGDILSLKAYCAHPALYAVFESLANRAEATRKALASLELDGRIAGALPTKIDYAQLRPEKIGSEYRFQIPVLRFRLSDEKVRELLMGRQLYGEPDLAIRELYQNALDACRYRSTRREYQRRKSRSLVEWTGRIAITQGIEESTGRPFVECVDNGVGMNKESLEKIFANAGERFVYRPAFRAEQAKWQDLDPPLEFVPNSQFGIGVFSYFMIAEEIEIKTWPTGAADTTSPHGFRVRIASSGSLFQITPVYAPAGGGTVVRLYLTDDDPISVLRTMRRLLKVAEFEVSVSEPGGPSEVWVPNELRYRGSAVTPLQHGEDFWWVTGEGGLAADGIATDVERFGLIVNLRGRRRPRFTVDRNRIRKWDREWIDKQVDDSLSKLSGWPGFTLNWLWQVTENTPQISEKILRWLVDGDRKIPLEGSWGNGLPPPAARVGCLPIDRDLFSGELNSWDSQHQWLARWRIAVWHGYARFEFMDRALRPQSIEGFPLVRPLDAAVIGKIYEPGWDYTSPLGKASVDDLIRAGADEEETPTERLRRLRRFAISGIDLRNMRQIPPVHYRFHNQEPRKDLRLEDRRLLHAVAAWSRPGRTTRHGGAGWLVYASFLMHIPLTEVVRRAAAIVDAAWMPPDPVAIDDFGHDVCTAADVELLARNVGLGPPWVGPDIPMNHLVRVSAKQGKSVHEVLAEFDRFAGLGYVVVGRECLPSDVTPIEQDALAYIDDSTKTLSPIHLMLLADRHATTVGDIYDALSRLDRSGLVPLPQMYLDRDMRPTREEIAIIRGELYRWDPKSRAERLRTGWGLLKSLASRIYAKSDEAITTSIQERRRLLDVVDPRRPVTIPEIVDLSGPTDGDVGSAAKFYQRLFPETADLSELPSDIFESRIRFQLYQESWAITNSVAVWRGTADTIMWSHEPAEIADGAADLRVTIARFLDRLEPFRPLGAQLPSLNPHQRALLENHIADRYDADMLIATDEWGVARYVRLVTPLLLIQTAGRFGWTVVEARLRFSRFEPLGLKVECLPAEECPDRVVDWQDLLILTVYFDGQEPALSGAVPLSHLAAAESEIGETTTQVRERLARYMRLFDFRVPSEAAQNEECDE